MMKNDSVAIGYIHNGIVHAPFMHSMMALQYDMGERFQAIECPGMFLAVNRSRIVDGFLDETKKDWLLFVDTDVAFKPSDVYRLVECGDDVHQVVAGLCFTWLMLPDRRKLLGPNWWETNNDGDLQTVAEIRQDRLNPLAYCGMAFTLIGREVLTTVRENWKSRLGMTTFGHDTVWNNGKQEIAGEDITFCGRAINCGFGIWGAGDVVVDHYKTHPVNMEMFQAMYGKRNAE